MSEQVIEDEPDHPFHYTGSLLDGCELCGKSAPEHYPRGEGDTHTEQKLKPIGPSSTDYDAWVSGNSYIQARFQEYPGFTQRTGYYIWRHAWLACEREHGIRGQEDADAEALSDK